MSGLDILFGIACLVVGIGIGAFIYSIVMHERWCKLLREQTKDNKEAKRLILEHAELIRNTRKAALQVSKETTERLEKDFRKAVVDDERYLMDVSKGGKTAPAPPQHDPSNLYDVSKGGEPPPPPKVDPEDKLRIAKGDDWSRTQ